MTTLLTDIQLLLGEKNYLKNRIYMQKQLIKIEIYPPIFKLNSKLQRTPY
jgi:hypothetical protein